MRWVLTLLLLLVASRVSAQTETRWYAVFLGAQQVGYFRADRELRGEVVETRSTLRLQLLRNGQPLPVESDESAIETRQGRPIGFSSRFDAAGTRSHVLGRIDAEGGLEVAVEQAGKRELLSLTWPGAAVLAEGQRLALAQLQEQPGASVMVEAFDASSLKPYRLLSRFEAVESLSLPDGPSEPLLRIVQRIGTEPSALTGEMWVERDGRHPQQMRLPALGLQLELRQCSQSCAEAAVSAGDVLIDTLVQAPRPLGVRERGRALRYALQLSGASATALATIPGQYLLDAATSDAELVVSASGERDLPPVDADRVATRWLQSDDAEVQALARSAVGRQRQPERQMRRLEQAVREHIQRKTLRIGYASAAEVVRNREGDCTEHAVLLAAMARSLGIAARVVTGIAYTPRFGAREDVFVPHAWVLAWVDGRWQGYDAALPRFDAGHIGFTMGNGDPFDFYAGLDLLGKLKLRDVEPYGRRALAALLAQRPREDS